MNPSTPATRLTRYATGTLLALLALNAFGGGIYGLSGAKNVPLQWLEGSPFHSYFIPGLFLFVVIGGSALFAAIAVFGRRPIARKASVFCGVVVLLWLAVQLSIIGYVSWMQPATATAAILILALTRFLPDPNA